MTPDYAAFLIDFCTIAGSLAGALLVSVLLIELCEWAAERQAKPQPQTRPRWDREAWVRRN
jgi:hypothetical protein